MAKAALTLGGAKTLVRSVALSEQVASALRVMIIGGELSPGTHLVEEALAKQFDVSRGPVRDAIRLLEAEGLIVSQRRGFNVAGLSETDVEGLYKLREALEAFALTEAIARTSDVDWDASAAVVAKMHDAAKANAAAEFSRLDMRFHSIFYELSGNGRLLDVWRTYEPTFAGILDVTNGPGGDLLESAGDHARLLDLARSADTDSAVAELHKHLLRARLRLRDVYASQATPSPGH